MKESCYVPFADIHCAIKALRSATLSHFVRLSAKRSSRHAPLLFHVFLGLDRGNSPDIYTEAITGINMIKGYEPGLRANSQSTFNRRSTPLGRGAGWHWDAEGSSTSQHPNTRCSMEITLQSLHSPLGHPRHNTVFHGSQRPDLCYIWWVNFYRSLAIL